MTLLLLAAVLPAVLHAEPPRAAIELTDSEFRSRVVDYAGSQEWKYLGDKPAVVDFYASWCGPCRALAPALERLAEKYSGRIYVYKVNIDKESRLAAVFGVESIPMLLFIPQTGTPGIVRGAVPEDKLEALTESFLLSDTSRSQ